ncbi:hypothetical protein QCM80_42600 [Bradyrhizobium sp. SSUT112]|uniref:hypothetical protein n=1 Tax=Bradyrhizobium sp. SSUT112 TaxID=3040604 RepID=UPI00244CD24A|nr:hypothetical protein [Bradyrhizobium sp. SSUT112]MDH2357225.1 hypothetical protein [Bradyrhizobium sp. SSUT112]
MFRNWEGRLPLVMRQHKGGGERLFVDYAGEMVSTVRRGRCVTRTSSSRSWPHPACRSRCDVELAARHWIAGHNAAYSFFCGATQLLVPDNAKVALIKDRLYDLMVNRSYSDMAPHYGTAIFRHGRVAREIGEGYGCVGIIEPWLLGRLRNHTFYSVAKLNGATAEWLAKLNDECVLRQYGRTRRQLFEEISAKS